MMCEKNFGRKVLSLSPNDEYEYIMYIGEITLL